MKYFFVFYICSLSQKNKSFPVLVKKKTSGAANNEIIADLEQLVHICNDVKLQVVGISFDGDASYFQYVDNMFQHIQKLPRLDLRCPLSGIIKEYVDVLIFEDMFHLVKCCRYRFVCGSDICPSLSSYQETFGLEDFRKIGIKDYILDHSKAKKMDDDLPLLFFSSENVETAMRIGRIDLLLALLPCYLLLSSVLSEGLNREQRLEKLNLGFSIALTYYKEYVNYDFTKGLQSRKSKWWK